MRPCGSISCQPLRPPPLPLPKSGGAQEEEKSPKEEVEVVKYCLESLVGEWRDTMKKPSTYEVSVGTNSKVTVRTTRHDGSVLVTTGLVRWDKDSDWIIWGLSGSRQYWLSKLDSRSLTWRHQHLVPFVWNRVGECAQFYGRATDCSRRRRSPPPLQCRDTESRDYVARFQKRVLLERLGHDVEPAACVNQGSTDDLRMAIEGLLPAGWATTVLGHDVEPGIDSLVTSIPTPSPEPPPPASNSNGFHRGSGHAEDARVGSAAAATLKGGATKHRGIDEFRRFSALDVHHGGVGPVPPNKKIEPNVDLKGLKSWHEAWRKKQNV